MNVLSVVRRWRLPRVAAGLGAATLQLGLVGAAVTRIPSFELLNEPFGILASRTNVPAAFTGGLLIAAGTAAIGLLARGAAESRGAWRLLGILLIAVGVEELSAFHEGVQRWSHAGWETVWALPAVAVAAAGIAISSRLTGTYTRTALVVCWCAWLVTQFLDGAAADWGWIAASAAETLEMGVAAAFVIALLAGAQELKPPAGNDQRHHGWRETVAALAVGADVRIVVLIVIWTIVGVAAAGAATIALGAPLPSFSPRGERNVITYAIGGLLVVAAALALAFPVTSRAQRRSWNAIAVLLLAVAVGEVFSVHEKLDDRIGIPGQMIYVPLVLAVIPASFVAWHQLRSQHRSLALLAGGFAGWALGQTLDFVSPSFNPPYAMLEETYELIGCGLILLGLLTALQGVARKRDRDCAGAEAAVLAETK